MAVLVKPLFIKDGDNVYECACYTVMEDALPTTCNAGVGDVWEIKNNNTVCYVGLWPFEATNKPPRKADDTSDLDIITPLKITRGDKNYNPLRYVLNTFNITIKATTNQKITFTYYDVTNEQQTVEVTSSDVTVTALAATQYTCEITAYEGYTKGGIQGGNSAGYVNESMTISATPATINSYVMTVVVPKGATITVGGVEYTEGTSTVTYNYATPIVVSCASTNAAQYSVGNLTIGGSAFTSGGTYNMPASAVTVTCSSELRFYTITVTQGTGTSLSVLNGSDNVPNGASIVYGTELSYSTSANTGYENADVAVGG